MTTKIVQYRGIQPLQPATEDGMIDRWEKLQLSAQHINQIALDLEAAILEFKAIASNLNLTNSSLDSPQIRHSVVCTPVSIPWIVNKVNRSLVLTTRRIDLYRAERDAANLAKSLRSKKKQKGRGNRE